MTYPARRVAGGPKDPARQPVRAPNIQPAGVAISERSEVRPSPPTRNYPGGPRNPSPDGNNGYGYSPALARIAPNPVKAVNLEYQVRQSAMGDYVSNGTKALWDVFMNPEDFAGSWKEIGPVIKVLMAQHYMASASDAAEFYRNRSVIHGLRRPSVKNAPLDMEHLNRVAGSVASGTFYHHTQTLHRDPVAAATSARNRLAGAADRFALLGGRNTILRAVANDPNAAGWERLLSPAPCSRCTQYAVQGPFDPGKGEFRAHDRCHCLAGPVFEGSRPTNEDLANTWNRVTGGISGKQARAVWDQFWKENDDGGDTTSGDGSGTQESAQ